MRIFLSLLILLLLASVPSISFAQDVIEEPVGGELTEPVTSNDAVDWLISILGVWGLWSAAAVVTFEAIKSSTLQRIYNLTPDWIETEEFQAFVYAIALGVASYVTVVESGFNMFLDAPEYIQFQNESWAEFWTAVFLFAGAFLFHNVGEYFGFQKIKRQIRDSVESLTNLRAG